jgi:GMP synthase-like glutamine amidotransferase
LTLIILQNTAAEKPGIVLEWARERKMKARVIRVFEGEAFPPPEDVEALVVLGAPVSVDDDLPWLKNERVFLERMLAREAPVLGLCFGAQLLAALLGAKIFPSPAAEIGWHEVKFTSFNLAETQTVLFQWHGEEFSLPEGARLLAKSRACVNHGFQKGFVTALTSHLEIDAAGVAEFISEFWDEKWFLREGRHSAYVQPPEEMTLALPGHCEAARKFAFDFLDLWSEGVFQSETPLKLLK